MSVRPSPDELLKQLYEFTHGTSQPQSTNRDDEQSVVPPVSSPVSPPLPVSSSAAAAAASVVVEDGDGDGDGDGDEPFDVDLAPFNHHADIHIPTPPSKATHTKTSQPTNRPVQPTLAPVSLMPDPNDPYVASLKPWQSAFESNLGRIPPSAVESPQSLSDASSPSRSHPNPFVDLASPPPAAPHTWLPTPTIAEHSAPSSLPISSPAVVLPATSMPPQPKRARIRTSSFSKIPKERETAALEAKMRLLGGGGVSGDGTTIAGSGLQDGPVSVIVGAKKVRPTPSYAMPTKASQRSAQNNETIEEREEDQIQAEPIAKPITSKKKKKRHAHVQAKVDSALTPRPRPSSSSTPSGGYSGELLSYASSASAAPLPLTLVQSLTCITHVLRVIQSPSAVDPAAIKELNKILEETAQTTNTHNQTETNQPHDAQTVGVATHMSDAATISSLQADQDTLLASQLSSPQLRLLSQLPSDSVAFPRIQRLFRWYLADIQRKGLQAANRLASASAAAASTHTTTPNRNIPTVIDVSLASTQHTNRHEQQQQQQQQQANDTTGHANTDSSPPAASSFVSSSTSSTDPPIFAPLLGVSSSFPSLPSSRSVSGYTTPLHGGPANSLTLASFFGAMSGPVHAAAATPILVKPNRYAQTPGRLLEHFRPTSMAYRPDRTRSASRSRAESLARTPRLRERSASLDRIGAGSGNVSGRSTPRSSISCATEPYDSRPTFDDPLDSTVLMATLRKPPRPAPTPSRTPARGGGGGGGSTSVTRRYTGSAALRRSASVGRLPMPSITPPSLHVAEFSPISSKLDLAPLSTSTSTRIDDKSSSSSLALKDDPDISPEDFAEIERMNRSLEALLANERARSASRRRRRALESHRDKTIRRPRVAFPGATELYHDDPRALEETRQRHSRARVRDTPLDRNGQPLSSTLTGHRDGAHIFSPPRAALMQPNAHAHQGPKYQPAGDRAAGYKHQPKARFMSFIEYETNLKHAREADSWKLTLAGKPSPHRRMMQSPPPALKAELDRERARSRSATPTGSPSPRWRVSRLETTPQARHMGYLTHDANVELFRQTSTYSTIIAGGSTGGSSQPPINYIRSTPVQPDRSIMGPKIPQARHMGYLSPEVNQAHIKEARTWARKIDGTYEPPRLTASTFRYRVEDDPVFRHHHGAPMITQARPMGYLSNDVNNAHFLQAQLLDARARVAGSPAPIPLDANGPLSPSKRMLTSQAAANLLMPGSSPNSARGSRSDSYHEEAKYSDSALPASFDDGTLLTTPRRSAIRARNDSNRAIRAITHEEYQPTPRREANNDRTQSDDQEMQQHQQEQQQQQSDYQHQYDGEEEPNPFEASELLESQGTNEEYDQEYEDAERYYTALRAQQQQQHHSQSSRSSPSAPPSSSALPPPSSSSSYDPFAAEEATLATATARRTSASATTQHKPASQNEKQLRPSKRQQ